VNYLGLVRCWREYSKIDQAQAFWKQRGTCCVEQLVLGLFAAVSRLWLFFRLPIFAGFFVACAQEISWRGRR